MKADISLVRRLSLPFLAVLTLAVLLISPNLPMTRAENATIMQAVAPQAAPNLQFSINCNGDDLVLGMSGDGPFEIFGYGPGLPVTPVAGPTVTFTGPGNWLGVRIAELGGDLEFVNLGDPTCPALPLQPIQVRTWCEGDNPIIHLVSGDVPARIEGSYPGLPAQVVYPSIIYLLTGPGVFTGITIREEYGDYETYTLPTVSCGIGQYTLQASASCDGTTLQINIPVGDSPFHLINSAGEYRTLYGVGTHLLTDYWPATGIIIRERLGDFESVTLGDIPCVAPTPTPTATPTATPTETAETPTETPPLPVTLPDYVPARVMQIAAVQPQIVYDQPGGEPIRNPDHSLLLLPQDSDGNGWDTFVVLDAQIYEGEVWLGVYLGGPQLGWLPESSFVSTQE